MISNQMCFYVFKKFKKVPYEFKRITKLLSSKFRNGGARKWHKAPALSQMPWTASKATAAVLYWHHIFLKTLLNNTEPFYGTAVRSEIAKYKVLGNLNIIVEFQIFWYCKNNWKWKLLVVTIVFYLKMGV